LTRNKPTMTDAFAYPLHHLRRAGGTSRRGFRGRFAGGGGAASAWNRSC
jgi:hypothetical protein